MITNYWKHSREVLDYEVEGCDVENVKTEPDKEFEEEEFKESIRLHPPMLS